MYVSRSIQGRMLGRFCAYWVVYHVFLVFALAMDALLSRKIHSFSQLGATLWQEHYWTLLILVAAFPIIFRDLLRTTQRLAGPLVRFEHVLKQMARGEHVEKVQLRKHDLLFDFQNAFNNFIETRNQQLSAAKRGPAQKRLEEIPS
jgi:hypothetical protein